MGEETKPEEAKVEEVKAEEVKAEEKKEEKPEAEEEEKKEEPKPPAPVVLYVDLHCVGCAKKIESSIMKIRGVEGVVIDMAKNEVTIKGILVEAQAVCNKIMKRTKRKALVLSPLPPAEGEPIQQVVASQVSGVTTVELQVNMHCEACSEQLKKKILKMRGVQNAVTDHNSGKVTVTGTMDGEKLVEYVYRRTRKQAKIVPQPAEPEPEKKDDEAPPVEEAKAKEKEEEEKPAAEGKEAKKEEEGKKEGEEKKEEERNEVVEGIAEEEMKRMMQHYYQPLYEYERIPPPQLFSDENPNACCIS